MFITPYERVKMLISNIQRLQDKLMNTAFFPMVEQHKLHAELKKYKEEMKLLEQRTKMRA